MTDLSLHRLHAVNQARKNTRGFSWARRFQNRLHAVLKRRVEQERILEAHK
jgi:hypothetical protein